MTVRPKKYLGQHFLKDTSTAKRIVDSLQVDAGDVVLEIGPGTGVLTGFLTEKEIHLALAEIDRESVEYLRMHYPEGSFNLHHVDFLKSDLIALLAGKGTLKVIGNFPYNISSQIFFKILENRSKVSEVVCMLQKEVARRIASGPGNKDYGILSVLLQTYFEIEYLFTVKPGAFHPPPKVDSGVIRLVRNERYKLQCDEKLFFRVVKQGFQNRRKTLRNALKPINLPTQINDLELLNRRAEQLSVDDFIFLTDQIESHWKT